MGFVRCSIRLLGSPGPIAGTNRPQARCRAKGNKMDAYGTAMLTLAVTAVIGGAVAGARAQPKTFAALRRAAIVALVAFLAAMAALLVVFRGFQWESTGQVRVWITNLIFVAAAGCLFTFCAGIAGLFRQSVRRPAGTIAGLSLLVIPICLCFRWLILLMLWVWGPPPR